jgi:hypothetical protein
MGNTDTDAVNNPEPQILPALQHKSIISVELGDYHNVALTSDGKLFSWGAYSKGALGLGDPAQLPEGSPGGFASTEDLQRAQSRRRGTPPVVQTPTEIRFDHGHSRKKDRFCIAATASGWHTGALVIDLEVSCMLFLDFIDPSLTFLLLFSRSLMRMATRQMMSFTKMGVPMMMRFRASEIRGSPSFLVSVVTSTSE